MAFEPGDVRLLHNHQILHARAPFEDWPETARRRHLLRLWLCPPDGRPLPPSLLERYLSLEIGERGGIVGPDTVPCVPLEPVCLPPIKKVLAPESPDVIRGIRV